MMYLFINCILYILLPADGPSVGRPPTHTKNHNEKASKVSVVEDKNFYLVNHENQARIQQKIFFCIRA